MTPRVPVARRLRSTVAFSMTELVIATAVTAVHHERGLATVIPLQGIFEAQPKPPICSNAFVPPRTPCCATSWPPAQV
jgi:hypothetical protein